MSALGLIRQFNVTYLGDVCSDDGHFCQHVEEVVEPSRQIGATCLCEIQPCDGAELDGKTLQQDGKEIAEQDDEQELEAVGRACSDVGRVVSRIDYVRVGVSDSILFALFSCQEYGMGNPSHHQCREMQLTVCNRDHKSRSHESSKCH